VKKNMKQLIEIKQDQGRCDLCPARLSDGKTSSVYVKEEEMLSLCEACSEHLWKIIDEYINFKQAQLAIKKSYKREVKE
jgi:Zn finger protein HypA/HybF involved in hydrogenase expression